MIRNCNCKRINCGCTLSFSSYVANSYSVLDVGNLLGGSCTFDEYVIDWYKDGEYYLTSGKGSDPDITAYHPFTGSAAIPVEGGIYTPRLRYVILTGETDKIYTGSNNTKCSKWCNFGGTLPDISITVTDIECGLVGTGINTPSTNYDFKLSYNTTQDYALASRRIKFLLDEHARYVAIRFRALTVRDKLSVYFNNNISPEFSLNVGTENYTSINLDTLPNLKTANDPIYQVFEVPTWVTGNYIIFEVTPSIESGNINTIWELDIKCLDNTFTQQLNSYDQSNNAYDLSGVALTYHSATCTWRCTINIPNKPVMDLNLIKYSGYSNRYPFIGGTGRFIDGSNYITMGPYEATEGYVLGNGSIGNNSPLQNAAGLITLTINNATEVCTIEFTAESDYLLYKNNHDASKLTIGYTQFINNIDNINYYRYFSLGFAVSGALGCGDNQSDKYFSFHLNSTIVFDDVNHVITITDFKADNSSTAYIDKCSPLYYNTLALPNSGQADGIYYSRCHMAAVFSRISYNQYVPVARYYGFGARISTAHKYTAYGLPNGVWSTQENTWDHTVGIYQVYITAAIDGVTGKYINPQDNFKITMLFNKYTGAYTLPGTVIYEISNGVVITNVLWEDL